MRTHHRDPFGRQSEQPYAKNCKLVKFVGQTHQDRMVATGSSAHEAKKRQRIAWRGLSSTIRKYSIVQSRSVPISNKTGCPPY